MKTHLLSALFLLGLASALAVADTIPKEDAQKRTAETIVAFSADHDIGKAKAGYRAALKLDPNYAPARYGLGLMLEAEEDWKGAREAFQQVMKNPKSGSFSVAAKSELADIEKTANALKTPNGRKRLAYDDLIAQARLLLRSKQIPEAAKRAAEARKLDDGRWEAYMVAGEAMQASGLMPEAVHFFNAATKRAPGLYKENLAGVARELSANPKASADEKSYGSVAISANAYKFPAKPYSSWSQAEQKELLSYLENTCKESYEMYCKNRCDQFKAGTIQPEELLDGLKFTASRMACFVNHLPADYPYTAQLRVSGNAAYDKAKKLEPAFPNPFQSQYISQGGLTWMPITFEKAWAEANSYCATTTINGQTGWRLPTIDELKALHASGAMIDQGWTLTYTWSSSSNGSGGHYNVNLNNGYVVSFYGTSVSYVTCVAGTLPTKAAQPVADNMTQSGAYFLQAGAYADADDAVKLKAKLAILGMAATVQTSSLPGQSGWYRVRLGPYGSADEMNKASAVLKQNGVNATRAQ